MSMAVNKYQSKASSTSISADMNRRKSLKFAAGCLMGTSTSFLSPSLSEAIEIDESFDTSSLYDSYRIIPDPKKLNPKLESVRSKKLLENISKKQGALWLGEHHNAVSDHLLQANVIQSICDQRKLVSGDHNMGIGLEMVQRKFQSALDDYVAGKITEEEMLRLVDWEKRWFWSFSKYRPIFTVARENKIPLIALNADSEDLALVERNGLPGLSQSTLSSYIPDRPGFASFASTEKFKTYTSYVITPSYEMHRDMGLLRTTMMGEDLGALMPLRNFLSCRILWDETMASTAMNWNKNNPKGNLIVGLIGADHVKFSQGVSGRYQRMISSNESFSKLESTSVMLNPTMIDTRPPSFSNNVAALSSQNPDKITLQLRYLKDGPYDRSAPETRTSEYTGGVLPLSDYLFVTKNVEASA